MNSMVSPRRRLRSRSRLTIWAWIETSRAETGSSATMKLGLDSKRAGDADALALAAGEFVGIAAHELRRQSHQSHECRDLLAPLLAVSHQAVDDQRLRDDVFAAHARIERGEGILKDRLSLPAERLERPLRQARDVAALEQDLAGGGIHEPQDAAPDGGLAGA